MSRDVPVCNGKCRKGAPDPACPLHGKGGKAVVVITDPGQPFTVTPISGPYGFTPR